MRLIDVCNRIDIDEALENIMSRPDTVINALTVLGCKPKMKLNGWIEARCPDHVFHAGHQSTHYDKWNCSPQGFTKCFTGNHTSTIIKTFENAWNVSTEEVIERLKHDDFIKVDLPETMPVEKPVDRAAVLASSLENYAKASDILSARALKFFSKDGINEDTLKFLGVKEHGDRVYIPFYNEDGDLCGYVAVSTISKEEALEATRKIDRTITEDKFNFKKAVYARGFRAGEHLYGMYVLNFNRNRDVKQLVIVEGERDAMKMLQEGFDCVAIHGTSLKQGQVELLVNHFPADTQIIIALDGDEAGQEGAVAVKEKLDEHFSRVEVIHLEKDPKKFSGEEFRQKIMNQIKEN